MSDNAPNDPSTAPIVHCAQRDESCGTARPQTLRTQTIHADGSRSAMETVTLPAFSRDADNAERGMRHFFYLDEKLTLRCAWFIRAARGEYPGYWSRHWKYFPCEKRDHEVYADMADALRAQLKAITFEQMRLADLARDTAEALQVLPTTVVVAVEPGWVVGGKDSARAPRRKQTRTRGAQ